MIKKLTFPILLFLFSSLITAQTAEDYFPSDFGHIWNYKIILLDSLGNPMENSTLYEIDSLAAFGNYYEKDSYLQMIKIGSAETINQQSFSDSLFINFEGAISNIYFNSILNSFNFGIINFSESYYAAWYPMYNFGALPGQINELFRIDTTITIDSIEIPSRITIESKRLQDEIIQTELGQFSAKKFEISLNYYFLSIIPIKLFSIQETYWFAQNNWLIKERREPIQIDLSQFNIPPFFIPGSQKDIVTVITDVEMPAIINKFSLSQNYPNPFNPETTIEYSIAENTYVEIKVFDLLGKEVATIVNENKTQGLYSVIFNSDALASGVYFYSIFLDKVPVKTKSMILLK